MTPEKFREALRQAFDAGILQADWTNRSDNKAFDEIFDEKGPVADCWAEVLERSLRVEE